MRCLSKRMFVMDHALGSPHMPYPNEGDKPVRDFRPYNAPQQGDASEANTRPKDARRKDAQREKLNALHKEEIPLNNAELEAQGYPYLRLLLFILVLVVTAAIVYAIAS